MGDGRTGSLGRFGGRDKASPGYKCNRTRNARTRLNTIMASMGSHPGTCHVARAWSMVSIRVLWDDDDEEVMVLALLALSNNNQQAYHPTRNAANAVTAHEDHQKRST